MLDELTPFEEAILNAHEFGTALAATQVITELVNYNV